MAAPVGVRPNSEKMYICCESFDFTWNVSDIKEFEQMWKMGIPIDYIARNFGRSNEEVALLIIDRAKKGHIRPRKGGLFGKGERL